MKHNGIGINHREQSSGILRLKSLQYEPARKKACFRRYRFIAESMSAEKLDGSKTSTPLIYSGSKTARHRPLNQLSEKRMHEASMATKEPKKSQTTVLYDLRESAALRGTVLSARSTHRASGTGSAEDHGTYGYHEYKLYTSPTNIDRSLLC